MKSEETRLRAALLLADAAADVAAIIPNGRLREAFLAQVQATQILADAAIALHGDREDAPPTSEPEPLPPAETGPRPVRVGLPGEFHRATDERPGFETRLDVPPGVYRRAVFSFTFHHGGWNEVPTRNHNLFWLARDRHRDLFGFGIAKGPGGPAQVFFRSDWGVRHTKKQRVVARHLLEAGETYRVSFDFDAGGGRIVLTLNSKGVEVLRSEGRPNIFEIPFAKGQRLAVGFGFRGEHENEPAQPGWVWSDLAVELQS